MNSEGKNSRLNANRMLRARKILGYVAERLQPPYLATSYCPEVEEGQEPPRIEDWLELLCNNQASAPPTHPFSYGVLTGFQIVPPTMTLATMRSHVWKMGGDVVLYYRRKEQPPAFGIKAPSENGESSENGGSSSASTIVMARDGHGEVPL